MKIYLSLILVLFFIVGAAVPARGDLGTATAGVSLTQFTIEGATAPFNYEISGRLLSISTDVEADLGVRLGLGLGYGNINGADFITLYPRVDWGFQILDYTFRISEGYQVYTIQLPGAVFDRYSYQGFTLGITGQWKVSEMLTMNAAVQIPETGAFYHGDQRIAGDTAAAHSYQYGIKITFLPLISYTVSTTYTAIGDQGTPFCLENQGVTLGVVFRW